MSVVNENFNYTYPITPAQILANRNQRKNAGLVGCLTGEDMPLTSLRGICWKVDSKGRMGDHSDYDPKDPGCFCFDCRNVFDPDGTMDAELVNSGHLNAMSVYLKPRYLAKNIPDSLPPAIRISNKVKNDFDDDEQNHGNIDIAPCGRPNGLHPPPAFKGYVPVCCEHALQKKNQQNKESKVDLV